MTKLEKLKVFITVKAYPNPSKSQAEAACIAGIDDSGKFVRLYPIPFRKMEDEQQFKKYQWIEVAVRPPKTALTVLTPVTPSCEEPF